MGGGVGEGDSTHAADGVKVMVNIFQDVATDEQTAKVFLELINTDDFRSNPVIS